MALALAQEAGETPQLVKNRDRDHELPVLLAQLGELLKDDTTVRKDDEFLTAFLRVRKYDVVRAAKNVRDFYVTMDRIEDLIQDIRPTEFVSVYDTHANLFLRARAQNGAKICLCTIRAWDTSQFNLRSFQQALTLAILPLLLQDKDTQLNGVCMILDFEDLSLAHMAQLTSPKELHRIFRCIQGGFPVRVTGMHCVNYPRIFWGLYFMVQGFLKPKLRRRFHFHSSLESLHQHFGKENLPETLGGPLAMSEAMDKEMLDRLLKEDLRAEEFYKIPVQESCECTRSSDS